jgi:carboxyl-terminal processing protease
MKLRGFQFIYATIAAFTLCSYILYETGVSPNAQSEITDARKDEVLLRTLMESLNEQHFYPKEINDAFSKDAFGLYLERMDFNKRFLLNSDVAALKMYDDKIDD